jgi:hypothetical protein
VAATKAPTRKATPRAKAASRARGSRQKRVAVPMSAEVKAAAAAALGLFEERLMESSDMTGASTRNLKAGNGVMKTVKLSANGNLRRAVISVRYR